MVITICSVVKRPTHKGVVCNTVCEAKAFLLFYSLKLHCYHCCYSLSLFVCYRAFHLQLYLFFTIFLSFLLQFCIFFIWISFHSSHTRSAFVSIIVLSSLSHFSLCLFSLITHIAHTNPSIHPRNTLKSKYQQQRFVPIWFRCQQHALGLWVGSLRLFAVLGQQRTLLVHHAHIGTV